MSLRELEEELTAVVERLRHSVVRIDRMGAATRSGEESPRTGSGSGVVLDPTGLVVTNDHVVRGAESVVIIGDDGRRRPGVVLGEDPPTDLALLRAEGELDGLGLAARLGDSSTLRAGQFVVAIGNSLGLPGEPTVSLGVVSAVHRPLPGSDFVYEGLLQTDAAINPGNSGGPLATLGGEVVGVTTAIVPYAQGVGFAVPSGAVQRIVGQIQRDGRVRRPWLGVTLGPTEGVAARGSQRTTGLVVHDVSAGGPAHRAGVQPGDVLFRVGSTGVRSLRDLVEGLASAPIGGRVEVALARGREERRALIDVAEAPTAPRTAAPPGRRSGR